MRFKRVTKGLCWTLSSGRERFGQVVNGTKLENTVIDNNVNVKKLKSGLKFYAPYKKVGYMEIGNVFFIETDFHPWRSISAEEALETIREQLQEYNDRCYFGK